MNRYRHTSALLFLLLAPMFTYGQIFPDLEMKYWKFWSGNSPNTYSYIDSVHIAPQATDSFVIYVKTMHQGDLFSKDTLVYSDSILRNLRTMEIIFNEKLKPGDTISFENDAYAIDSVIHDKYLDGVIRKKWYMHAINTNGWHYPAVWVQGLGDEAQGFNWDHLVSTRSIPSSAAICANDSLIYWRKFTPVPVEPSCDFVYLDSFLSVPKWVPNWHSSCVHPNPIRTVIYVNPELEGGTYQITDPQGKLLQSGEVSSSIDAAELPNGVLYITLIKSGNLHVQKVIKVNK